MRYAESRLIDAERDEAYRIYVTDSLYALGQSKCLTQRYIDIVTPERRTYDMRSGDEVAFDVIQGAGLHFAGDE